MAQATDREKLKDELAASRAAIGAYVDALRFDLDLRTRLKRGVRRSPLVWYAGAAVIGLLLSRIPVGRRKTVIKVRKRGAEVTKEAGRAALGLTVLKFGLDLAKPALLRWLSSRYLGPFASRFSGSGSLSPTRPPFRCSAVADILEIRCPMSKTRV